MTESVKWQRVFYCEALDDAYVDGSGAAELKIRKQKGDKRSEIIIIRANI